MNTQSRLSVTSCNDQQIHNTSSAPCTARRSRWWRLSHQGCPSCLNLFVEHWTSISAGWPYSILHTSFMIGSVSTLNTSPYPRQLQLLCYILGSPSEWTSLLEHRQITVNHGRGEAYSSTSERKLSFHTHDSLNSDFCVFIKWKLTRLALTIASYSVAAWRTRNWLQSQSLRTSNVWSR